MKVLLLIDDLDNGGAERQMALLAEHLPHEFERRVWAMSHGPFEEHLLERGVPLTVDTRRARFDPSVLPRLWRIIRTWRPDLVHSWSWMSTFSASPLCRLLQIPLVDGTPRTGVLQDDFLTFKRVGMAAARLVVANSYAGLDAWRVPARKGRVVYNGFERDRLRELPPRSEASACCTVIMTGRMVPVKDYRMLIEAARRLAARDDTWRFVLVGRGPDRSALQTQAENLVARGIVSFPEPGMEVLRLVNHADIGVLLTNPSLAAEGCSNSIIEYMACGLPTLCTRSGGNVEVITEGQTGFLLPAGDLESLCGRLVWLRDHPAERKAMGEAAKREAETRFSIETMVDGMLAVYAEALS